MKLSIEELRRHLAGDTVLSDGEKDEYLAALLEVAETAHGYVERYRSPGPVRSMDREMLLTHSLDRLDFEKAP